MTGECVQLVFFEYLIKLDHDYYTSNTFHCLYDLILHFNIQFKVIKPIGDGDQFWLMSEELIGMECVWHLFFESSNEDISTRAMDFLMQILKLRCNFPKI